VKWRFTAPYGVSIIISHKRKEVKVLKKDICKLVLNVALAVVLIAVLVFAAIGAVSLITGG